MPLVSKPLANLLPNLLWVLSENRKGNIGLVPFSYHVEGNDIRIDFNVPNPPLCFDTVQVKKIANYGFNVIRRDGTDITSNVAIDNNSVVIHCVESPINCKLRYGINGEFLKGGRNHGPRGNLRDSEKDCFQLVSDF